jgi:hypothetical protein
MVLYAAMHAGRLHPELPGMNRPLSAAIEDRMVRPAGGFIIRLGQKNDTPGAGEAQNCLEAPARLIFPGAHRTRGSVCILQ